MKCHPIISPAWIFLIHTNEHHEQCPDFMSQEKIFKMRDLCKNSAAKCLFDNSKMFQRDSVKDWNPTWDKAIDCLNLGITPVEKKDSAGAAIVFLNMCLKFGTLEESDNETWTKGFLSAFRRM